MRRRSPTNRPRPATRTRPTPARLTVEELERREVLAPFVFVPTFDSPPQTAESAARTFAGSPNPGDAFDGFTGPRESFGVDSTIDTPSPPLIAAVLTADHGTLRVDPAFARNQGVTVAGNGTAALTLTGATDAVDRVFDNGYVLDPDPYYSGEVAVELDVTDVQTAETASGSIVLQVLPDASPVELHWNADGEQHLSSEPFAFPPGFLRASGWPDADGSETLTVYLSLDGDDPSRFGQFVLRAGRAVVPQLEPGLWALTGTDRAGFQALLDSLVLVPPDRFSGRITLFAFGELDDVAAFPSAEATATDTQDVYAGPVALRFFEDGVIVAPPFAAPAGDGPIDLAGRFAVSDPAALPGDTHTLTLGVAFGDLSIGPNKVPGGLTVELTGEGDTLELSGSLAAINRFLATPGALLYRPEDRAFAGPVSIALVLWNDPGEPPDDDSPHAASAGGDGPPPTIEFSTLVIEPRAGSDNRPDSPDRLDAPAPAAPVTPKTPAATATVYGAPGEPDAPDAADGHAGGAEEHAGEPGGADGRLGEDDGREDVHAGGHEIGPRPPIGAYADGGPGDGPHGADGPRGGSGPAAQNQHLLRADAQPLYAGDGTRHPLPPVFPLDGTRPAAGFSESAGDSLGLVDQLLRDAAGPEQVLVALVGPPAVAAPPAKEATPPAPEPPAAAAADPGDADSASESAAANYACAAAVVASAAGWLTRGRVAAALRRAARWRRPTPRQPTQGNA